MTTGMNVASWTGWWLYVIWMAIVVAVWWAASPLTIRYPVNDHRAVFNVKQLDWTPESLENPNGDPLLEAMARFPAVQH